MKLILGGGVAGLLLAERLGSDSIVLESQPRLGGVFTFEDILGYKILYHPPLLNESCEFLSFDRLKLRIFTKKEKYILNKLNIPYLPQWLEYKDTMYYPTNLLDTIESLMRKSRVINGTLKKFLNDRKLLTNKGILEGEEIYVTISRKYIAELLGKRISLKSVSILELLTIINRRELEWDIYINGDSGVSFSHIINAYWMSDSYTTLYILVPFVSTPPLWDKVYSDLKREKILVKDEIIAYRSRIIRDGILIGEDSNEYPANVKFYGRLGKWKNFTLCETIRDILQN